MNTALAHHPTVGMADDFLHVEVWSDPLDADGIGADTDDALMFLTPFLGPTSTLLLHRLTRALNTGGRQGWTLSDLAGTFGVSVGQIDRTIDRLERFGFARRDGFRLVVRTRFSTLPSRHTDRFPDYLAAIYHQTVEAS